MKNLMILRIAALIAFSPVLTVSVKAQENSKTELTAGADIYSSFIWRGTRYGTGPVIQPSLKLSAGFFSAGAWGSFDFNGYQETDLWFSFTLPAGLSTGITDYYYPEYDYFDYTDSTGSHAIEINASFSRWGLSLSANYIFNRAGNAGSVGGDIYFEAKYSFSSVFIFGGAGNGWHSTDTEYGTDRFRICNLGLGITRKIEINEKFMIPVNVQLIFNPDRNKLYIVAGLAF